MTASREGPFEARTWPDELVATVVTSDGRRLHGYDVADDLAAHYAPTDAAYLAYVGELPEERVGRAFATWWTLASVVLVAEAPGHAAVLAGTCGALPAGVVQVAAVALAEQAAAWTEAASRPPAALASGPEVERVRALRRATLAEEDASAPRAWGEELVLALHRLGLADARAVCGCLVAARLPVCVAEALARRAGDFASYPANQPAFEYVEEPVDGGDR